MEKRKNIALRAATVLCVLVLFCAAFVGGTFAKYVTNDKADDLARVAKWGIVVSINGTLFGADYAANTALTNPDKIVVESTNVASSDDANIVAPGTESDEGFVIRLSGTPEVQYSVTADVDSKDIQDIYLSAGKWGTMVAVPAVTADNYKADTYYIYDDVADTYAIDTTDAFDADAIYYELHDEVTLAEAYYPILWAMAATKTGSSDEDIADESFTNQRNLVTAVNNLLAAIEDDDGLANNTLDATYTLSWAWAFTGNTTNIAADDVDDTDEADTILGNLMAANAEGDVVIWDDTNSCFKAPTARADASTPNDYNLNVVFGMNVTVTQVD